jgi:hypothetical protein
MTVCMILILSYNITGSSFLIIFSFSDSLATGRIKLPDMLVEQSWLEALPDEFQKPYAPALCMFVGNEYFAFKDSVYPPPHLIFDAFNTTPFHSVKAVILGQVCGFLFEFQFSFSFFFTSLILILVFLGTLFWTWSSNGAIIRGSSGSGSQISIHFEEST